MPQQSTNLNTDQSNVPTSSEFADRGDGTSKWYQWRRTADGGDVTTGAKADAAVTDYTASGSLVALLKGLLSTLRQQLGVYPVGATPVSGASGNVANASAVATLAAAVDKTTYITGFSVTFAGATGASNIIVAITGTTGGTLSYIITVPAGAAVAGTPLHVTFSHPVPASATNTAIVVTVPALGAGNTHAAAVATGFQL